MADNAQASQRRFRAFLRWMTARGVEWSDALQFSALSVSSPGGSSDGSMSNIGVLSRCKLQVGDLVARIPKSACLTIRTTAAADLIQNSGLVQEEGPRGVLGLVVAVMFERMLGEQSDWFEYLAQIPRRENLPVTWQRHEIERLLKGTEIYEAAILEKKAWREEWQQFVLPLTISDPTNFPSRHFDFHRFVDAKTLVLSRSFEIDGYHGVAMMPLADLFNHRTAKESVHFETTPEGAESDSADSDDDDEEEEATGEGTTNSEEALEEASEVPPPAGGNLSGARREKRKSPMVLRADVVPSGLALADVLPADVARARLPVVTHGPQVLGAVSASTDGGQINQVDASRGRSKRAVDRHGERRAERQSKRGRQLEAPAESLSPSDGGRRRLRSARNGLRSRAAARSGSSQQEVAVNNEFLQVEEAERCLVGGRDGDDGNDVDKGDGDDGDDGEGDGRSSSVEVKGIKRLQEDGGGHGGPESSRDVSDSDEKDADFVDMVVVREVEAGGEVFNTYGELGNASLLMRYGFAEQDNPYDFINIDLRSIEWAYLALHQEIPRGVARRRFRRSVSLLVKMGCAPLSQNDCSYFEIARDGVPQIELMLFLFLLALEGSAERFVECFSKKEGIKESLLWVEGPSMTPSMAKARKNMQLKKVPAITLDKYTVDMINRCFPNLPLVSKMPHGVVLHSERANALLNSCLSIREKEYSTNGSGILVEYDKSWSPSIACSVLVECERHILSKCKEIMGLS